MTGADAQQKVSKLLAMAAPGSGATPDEAATAQQIAHQICAKYGITPTPPRPPAARGSNHILPGQVSPTWTPPPRGQGTSWWDWASRPFGDQQPGYSGINDTQARAMALTILSSGAFLDPTEFEVVESALNGLLTEYGKILLDGLYTLML